MQLNTNGRSKVLECLYKAQSPMSKITLANATGLSIYTMDKYCADLKVDGYIKTDGNGYWSITQEGREQFELDPNLPAKPKAKDSSRVFSLGKVWDDIECDPYSRGLMSIAETFPYKAELLQPIAMLWLAMIGEVSDSMFKDVEVREQNDEYAEALNNALNLFAKIKKY